MPNNRRKCHKNKELVTLTNCSVTRGKWSEDLEIVVKDSTILQISPSKYTAEDTNRNIEVNNSLNITFKSSQEINVQAKVIRIDHIEHLEDGRRL